MGLLELLKKYNDAHSYRQTLAVSMWEDGSCRFVDAWDTSVTRFSFRNPAQARDWLVAQTTDQSDDTKVYL